MLCYDETELWNKSNSLESESTVLARNQNCKERKRYAGKTKHKMSNKARCRRIFFRIYIAYVHKNIYISFMNLS